MDCIFLGAMLSVASTTILSNQRLGGQGSRGLIFGILIVQDILPS